MYADWLSYYLCSNIEMSLISEEYIFAQTHRPIRDEIKVRSIGIARGKHSFCLFKYNKKTDFRVCVTTFSRINSMFKAFFLKDFIRTSSRFWWGINKHSRDFYLNNNWISRNFHEIIWDIKSRRTKAILFSSSQSTSLSL